MTNQYFKKLKYSFSKITRDPFADWFLIVLTTTIGVVAAAVWSITQYQMVMNEDSVSSTAHPQINKVSFDIKKLNSIIEVYDTKKEFFGSASLPKIDVIDPSL